MALQSVAGIAEDLNTTVAASGGARGTPNVEFQRPELKAMLPIYELINDAISGSLAVKKKKAKYLPVPNADNPGPATTKRYAAYLKRAVFYGVTGRTLRGLLGQIFIREPVLEVPEALNPVVEDTNGEGVSLVQLAKKTGSWVIAFGRGGLFVDYPTTNGQVTKEQLEDEGIRPVIKGYDPSQIINWRTRKRGAKSILCMVVLAEKYTAQDDGFEIKFDWQWRVLRLTEANVYTSEIWRKTANKSFVLFEQPVTPLDASGKPFKDIPFCFIGAENNDSDVDDAPLYDLADLNLAHYRNSADHEENLYLSAQATPVITGLTEQWADKYFKEGVGLGVGSSIPLPANADAKLMQAEKESGLSTEMEHKERQMVSLGAKLVEQKQVQRTATEASQEEASESSTLSNIAGNLSLAFTWALGWAALFAGVPETGIKCEFNKDFDIAKLSSADRAQTISEWQAEAITWEEMRAILRKGGVATLPDDEARQVIMDTPPLPTQTGGDRGAIPPREQEDNGPSGDDE